MRKWQSNRGEEFLQSFNGLIHKLKTAESKSTALEEKPIELKLENKEKRNKKK